MKIYVASSWRNVYQPVVVARLREENYQVYDFKDVDGFHWSEVDPNYQEGWKSDEQWLEGLFHPAAIRGFNRDMGALEEADTVVMVMPCGRSACLELGYAIGTLRRTAILVPEKVEPDLMFKMADIVVTDLESLVKWL